MLLFIFFALLFLGLVFKRNNVVTVLIFVFVWLFSWNDQIADFVAYRDFFLYDDAEFRDYGYYVLNEIFRWMGVDFLQFKLILMAFALGVTCFFILQHSYYPSFIASMYLGFSCYFDIAQYRNFVAFSFVLLGVHFLLQGQSIRDKMFFVLFVFLGASVHASVLFFLVFVLIDKTNFESLQNFLKKICLPLLCILFMFFSYSGGIIYRVEYYKAQISVLSIVMLVVMYVVNVLYVWVYDRRVPIMFCGKISLLSCNVNRFILWANILFLSTFPMAAQNLNNLRLFKYMSLLNIIFISNRNARSEENVFSLIQDFFIILYCACILGMYYFMHPSFKDMVMEPLFLKNILFE